jgi:protease I
MRCSIFIRINRSKIGIEAVAYGSISRKPGDINLLQLIALECRTFDEGTLPHASGLPRVSESIRRHAVPKISNAKILILATDGFEQSELEVPREKLKSVAQLVHVAAPKERKQKDAIIGWQKHDWGKPVKVDVELADVSTSLYDALVLPGGQMNPDTLRINPDALKLIKAFVNEGKVVAAICHAPWLLIEANAIRGRKATSYQSIKTDVINAGAQWVDEAVVTDQGIITSRNPGDLDVFVAKIIEEVEEGKHERAVLAA